MQNPKRRFPLLVRVVVGPLIGLLFLTVVLLLVWRCLDTRLPFDAKVWRSNPGGLEGKDTMRSRMIKDLATRRLHIGMTRREIRALLGPPDYGSEWDRQNNRDVYGYGYEGYMGIDPSVLRLQYDAAGRLTEISFGET